MPLLVERRESLNACKVLIRRIKKHTVGVCSNMYSKSLSNAFLTESSWSIIKGSTSRMILLRSLLRTIGCSVTSSSIPFTASIISLC